MKSREAFDKIADHVVDKDTTEQGQIVFEGISAYYQRDPEAKSCDPSLLKQMLSSMLVIDKHKQVFERIIDSLEALEVSAPNVVEVLLEHRRKIAGEELASALLANDKDLISKRLQVYDELNTAVDLGGEEEKVAQGTSVHELIADSFNPEGLIRVMPIGLNARLDGGVRPGHHILVQARPEMGKTALMMTMVHGFLEDGHKVLYVGNEDPLPDLQMRIINRLSEMTKHEVLEDPDRADELSRQRGYENLVMASLAPGSVREITRLVQEHEPRIVILDQIRNINTGQDNFVLKLQEAGIAARNIAKRHDCVVVSTTQANDSATDKAILEQGDIDMSNTGLPATADVIVGIGATKQHAERSEIVLSLSKNKVSGDHTYNTCRISTLLSKVESLD